MINLDASNLSVKSVQRQQLEKTEKKAETRQAEVLPPQEKAEKVSPDLAKVVYGVQSNSVSAPKKKEVDPSTQYVQDLPFADKLSPSDKRNLARVIRKNDEETDYMKRMIALVCEDKVNPYATATLCKHGVMSDFAKRDLDIYRDKVQGEGMSVKDAFVPEFASAEEAKAATPVGDVFRVAGQDNIFIKNGDNETVQLKMDADTYLELYPPVERYSACQGANGDCYLLSSINSIMENPYTRSTVLQCFEQQGNDVVVKLPNSSTSVTYKDGKMPEGTDMSKFTDGPMGMKMLERAYGVEIEKQTYDQYTEAVTKEQKKMQKELAKWEKKQPQDNLALKKQREIKKRMENWSKGQAEVDEAMKDPNHKLMILTDDAGELIIGKFGPMTEDVDKVDAEYKVPADYYTGGVGGFMDVATKQFGFESEDYDVGVDEEYIDEVLKSEYPYDYLISAGTYPEIDITDIIEMFTDVIEDAATDASATEATPLKANEQPQEVDYSIYSSHAYKIMPFDDKNGRRKFKVTNPWNQSHAVIMTLNKVKEFFQDIAIAKVAPEGQHNGEARKA